MVVKIDYLPCVNYAMMNSGMEICNALVVENDSGQDRQQMEVAVSGTYIKESRCRIETLKTGQSMQLNTIRIEPDFRMLSELTEEVKTSFTVRVTAADALLSEEDYPITLLSYEQWAGSAVMPEHLAAFVVPNHPVLSRVTTAAARFLEKWTGSAAFDEYQTQDRNRVRAQVAAIYEALRSEGIVYSAPPASFETAGQRIRMADRVLSEKVGTCIDTSLLVASCLESVGIYPIVLLLKDHAMVGAWLSPTVFPQTVCDDASYLLKETADGNNNMVLLESTAITASQAIGFEEAVGSAMAKLRDDSRFLYFVDIHRCRLGNVRPLPQRVVKNGTLTVENDGIEHPSATQTIQHLSHYDLRLEGTAGPTTKQMIWERKLLDFSLRNNLLNTRLGRRVVPFISFEIEHLEDHLQNAEDYHITPAPGKKMEPGTDGMYDSAQQAGEYRSYVSELIGDHKIASYLTDNELQNALKYVYRTARTSLEENGANSLFLALGMLKWFETAKSEQPRYAPILLLPVDIVRRSGNKYVIRKRDEDIIPNITLVELLKQNFKINLDILKELPKDDNGVDVKLIFTYVRRAIIEQKKWNVLEECMLGLFSFNKFVMWNDIHTNADKLKENPIVASLIENSDQQTALHDPVDARSIDKENAPMDFAIPLDVDSSQMEAIVESGRGRSFILHGPPGTGKSQTITNMIANALYQGRRVLFVAEKMAALSVVQSRLEKIGLAPFCLELHSNKATKKHFLEQMDKVLKVKHILPPKEYARSSDELFCERKELISYMEALHEEGPAGLSLYECISQYLAIAEDEAGGQLPPLEHIDAAFIARCREQVEQMQAILAIVGVPARHPLYGLEPLDNRQETLQAIHTLLQDFDRDYDRLNAALSTLGDDVSLVLKTDADIEWLRLFAAHVASEKQRDEIHEQIATAYSEDMLHIDVAAYLREWHEVKSKWFLPRYFAKKNFLKSLQRYGQIFASGVDETLRKVDDYQQLAKQIDTQAGALSAFARDHGINNGLRRDCYENYIKAQPKARRQEFLASATLITGLAQSLTGLTQRLNTLTLPASTKDDVANRHKTWLGDYGKMKDWYHWVDKKQELKRMELDTVVSLAEQGTPPQQAVNAVLKSMLRLLIGSAIDANAQLRLFNGLKFRQQIEKYKRDTARFQELSKQELYSKLAARVPTTSATTAEGSEISILKRNIANGGRGNSIRSILDSIPTLLPRLCPCMLMSPISVAQYIDLDREKFDLVIFDEASQMPTSEAVGAIARGKALVVVGDSKQMPPTSFFTTTQVDEEEADIDDMESILDDCITLSLCEHQLNWHYRSKHESLIAFSNSQYYDNALLTFPSADDHVAKVRMVHVDGVYDKGHSRSNPEESKAIVGEVIRRLSDPELSQYSIGIVAFSKVQGDRIEDDLIEQLDKHPKLKEVAYGGREPIFVKNLENVQGDERDVILFSVGYGADKTGKVSMNFGPLNNAGGERRLNVAVSRARYEMVVFSTMTSAQIDLKRSHAKGVEGLKGFLEFAETGRLPLVSGTAHEAEHGMMVEQICQALEQNGYVTEQHVGRSNFKVDIAVATREQPEHFILGLLCDGRNYHETKTTRDREIVQPSVLRMLGWRVMRVYSIDWYENRQRALEQILEELKSARKGVPTTAQEEKPAFVFDARKIRRAGIADTVDKNSAQIPYTEALILPRAGDKENFQPTNKRNASLVRQILRSEQPITEGFLCKRLARSMGFSYTGPNVQRAVAAVLPTLYRDPLSIDGINSYWLNAASARGYSSYRSPSARAINEIPAIEIVNVIKETLREEYSLPADKIPTIAARKLGFSSAGAKISETIRKVLALMQQQGLVGIVDGQTLLNENQP